MLNRVSLLGFVPKNYSLQEKSNLKKQTTKTTNPVQFFGKNVSAEKLSDAYKGYNNIRFASSISFTGAGSLSDTFKIFNKSIVTCKDVENGRKGESVGSRLDVSKLVSEFKDSLPNYDDAIKSTIQVSSEKNKKTGLETVKDARVQIKKGAGDVLKMELVLRPPRAKNDRPHRTSVIPQIIDFEIEPYGIKLDDENKRSIEGTPENAYLLTTKGKMMAVVEDGDNVLLTNTGSFEKKNSSDGILKVKTREYELKDTNGSNIDTESLAKMTSSKGTKEGLDAGIEAIPNKYLPFEIKDVVKVKEKTGGSQGGGTELVIGLEQGRFVDEIIDSIETFVQKVNDGEIVLDEFVPAKGAQNMQLSMLAGGYGSRAEYTNASSSKIFHDKENGSNLTKGCFRTATGLTPMETTFISLHKAGLLDCSKGNLGIGKNIKFYLNDSGVNGGNGGFTVDMYNTMKRDNRESLLILPNDAMSRIPHALSEMNDIMNSGKAAVVMVAKEVDKEDARGSLGIMKINDKGEIEAFAEKPKEFEEGYVDENDKCFANTFQFAVSKEAFEALSILENYLPSNDSGKEPRDWSKTFTPILMALTQNDEISDIRKQANGLLREDTPDDVLEAAKNVLKDKKIYAVKSSEPWADCGTLNALYHTTMQIASGEFPLEDFERKHVIDSVNTKTGLVASTPKQKQEIEEKYKIKGQVMAVPKAKPVPDDVLIRNKDAITKYSDKN